jgi:hypothetical protein
MTVKTGAYGRHPEEVGPGREYRRARIYRE